MTTRAPQPLFVALVIAAPAFAAEPAPASSQAFMALPAIYVSVDLTQVGSRDFSAPKDSLTDGAYRVNKRLSFEMPMNMQLPGSCPTTLPMEEQMEEGRCMGWAAAPPEDPDLMDKVMSGKIEMAKNPMFVPGEYSVDDVSQFRFRDTPKDGFGTQTTTYKGKGSAYVAKTGMVLCDFKKLTCDVANIMFGTSAGDPVTQSTTSDVPGFAPQASKQDPALLVPQVPAEAAGKMTGLPFSLSGPKTSTFSVPGKFQNNPGPDIVVKVTISPRAAGRAAPAK